MRRLLIIGLLLGCAAGALGQASPAFAQGHTVSVFPVPGAHTAAPQTQITFRGVPVSQLGTITVTGSQTGVHSGAVQSDSDGRGGSFIPAQPFAAGETVTVSTGLNIDGSGSGTYSFTVAIPAGGFPNLHWAPAPRVSGDVQSFHSRHDLTPVSVQVLHRGAQGSGDIFVAPQWGPLQDGPMILDPGGNLIWFDALRGNDMATDFAVQRYQGQPVLTWWQGHIVAGIGIGQDIIFDRTYRQVAAVQAGNGLSADLHEFQVTPQGTALIIANYPVFWNASSVHGSSRQIVLDSVVQEIDIPTGLVLFQWDSLDHIPLTLTYSALPKSVRSPFDPYHLNSVQLDDDGNLLISARNTWAAYKVSHSTGAIIWTLGGRHSSFKLAPGTYWAFQHDVRARGGDHFVTIFDDDAGPPTIHSQSRAVKLLLNFQHMTARQYAEHDHSPPLSANYEGNLQALPNHDDFVGWGAQPYFTEYSSRGRVVFDARLAGNNATYRAFRFPWSAVPWNLPAVAASSSGRTTTVYVSWNGATGVAGWRVYGGASPTALHYLASASKRSFETTIQVRRSAYVEVQAMTAAKQVIKSSLPTAVH